MDIDKLIEQLNRYFEGETLPRGTALDAATALSTLQAENEKLRAELEKVKAERDEIFHLLEDTCKAIREKSVEDYVCWLCEYGGDWVNECPGFERDDCFCLKESLRERFGQKEA